MATASSTVGARGSSGGWLYGPFWDVLLGCGALYLLSIPLLLVMTGGQGAWPATLATLFTLCVSGPHYGATILRVYDHREERRKYAFFAVWVTLALAVAFVVGLWSVLVGSILMTLYVSWSPWHFAGQNYGIAVMFLRRRGVPLRPVAKRLFHLSFFLSFVIAFLVIHGHVSPLTFATFAHGGDSETYRILPLGLTEGVVKIALPAVATVYAGCLVGTGVLLGRDAQRLRDLIPAAMLVVTQALWFVLPALLPAFTNSSLASAMPFAAVWLAANHAIQYLWITSWYARRSEDGDGLGRFLAKALAAGSLTVVPIFLYSAGVAANLFAFNLGVGIVLASVVNLHHFILDGAIWKLRDGRVARTLVRSTPETPRPEAIGTPKRGRLRAAVGLAGALALALSLFDLWEREFGIKRAGNDLSRVMEARDRLSWIGRDWPGLHARIGDELARRGRLDAAAREYRRSLDQDPTAEAWVGLGEVHQRRGRWGEAAEAYDAALELEPENLTALFRGGLAWLETGQPERARELLAEVVELKPESGRARHHLERAEAALARTAAADSAGS